ncbi:MAG: ArsR/SmtB family transcription factor [Bacillota bacterium]
MNYELIFKTLGESTRIKIVKLLALKPMYVCELESVLDMSQPRISQHLKILKHANLVNDTREGQRSIYSLNRELLQNSFLSFTSFLDKPLEELSDFQEEYERLSHLSDDPKIVCCKSDH